MADFQAADHSDACRRPIRVVVADGQPVVRSGLVHAFEPHSDVEVVGTAGSGDQALELVQTLAPDVLVMNLDLPGLPAVDVVRQVRTQPAPTHILILTAHGEAETVVALLSAGATGYLLKAEQPELLITAVRAVAQGTVCLSAASAAGVVQQAQAIAQARAVLTNQERTVMRLLAARKSTSEIALQLGIGERTVRSHLHNIYDKLGVNGREAAIAWAQQRGLGKHEGDQS